MDKLDRAQKIMNILMYLVIAATVVAGLYWLLVKMYGSPTPDDCLARGGVWNPTTEQCVTLE